jgi:hypothetical protein
MAIGPTRVWVNMNFFLCGCGESEGIVDFADLHSKNVALNQLPRILCADTTQRRGPWHIDAQAKRIF